MKANFLTKIVFIYFVFFFMQSFTMIGEQEHTNLEIVDFDFGPESYKLPKKLAEKRFAELNLIVEPRLDNEVKVEILSYLKSGRKGTERKIGRVSIFFPLFDHYLKKYNLPKEIKILAFIESGLNPLAESKVGAKGLWQFMPSTGKLYGLEINDYVDERCDPNKSTDAAMQFLGDLYDQFEDWELAIAAYNCGPGRVRKAIRLAQSKKYSKISKYLPKETRRYLKRFLAAQYIINYYMFHGIKPNYPDYNFTMTESVVLYNYETFKNISSKTGIPVDLLRKLNPSYKTRSIPQSKSGNFFILPVIGRNNAEAI